MGDVKAYVHQWCAKNSSEPNFEVRPTGKRRHYNYSYEISKTLIIVSLIGSVDKLWFLEIFLYWYIYDKAN